MDLFREVVLEKTDLKMNCACFNKSKDKNEGRKNKIETKNSGPD